MKKILLFVAVAAFVAIGFSSCKKCSTCVIKESGATIYTYPEVCGNKADIDAYEAAAETAYSGSQYTIECGK